jgi:hypothetical protein
MATTSDTYTAPTVNGTNKLFTITFDYLDESDIDVYLNGTLQTSITHYTFANATTIEFVTAPPNGATVLIARSTSDTNLQATFFPGSSIKASDLNNNFNQVLYIAQETVNSAASQSTAGLQTQITAATNTANTALTTANAADATATGIAGTANTALTNANAAVVTANAASVTANNALPKSGGTMTGVITFASAQPRLVRGTAQASTSGTAINFHDIPSWVNRLTMMLNGVSINGSEELLVQFGTGTSGSPVWVTSGYDSNANTSGSGGSDYNSTGFLLETLGSSSYLRSGLIHMCRIDGNVWVYNSSIKQAYPGDLDISNDIGAGNSGNLGGVLTQVRLTTTGTPNTFDAGTVNILYEG